MAYFGSFISFFGKAFAKTVEVEEGYSMINAIGLQRESEFKGVFNYYLTKLKATGIASKIELKWLRSAVAYMRMNERHPPY